MPCLLQARPFIIGEVERIQSHLSKSSLVKWYVAVRSIGVLRLMSGRRNSYPTSREGPLLSIIRTRRDSDIEIFPEENAIAAALPRSMWISDGNIKMPQKLGR